MISDIIPRLKATLHHTPKLIQYFNDGCAAQYKRYKVFENLMKHREDFGMDAK